MRLAAFTSVAAASVFAHTLIAGSGIVAPEVTVGRALQTPITVRLPDTKPRKDLKLTIRSSDPRRLLLSDAPDKLGSPSIVLTMPVQFIESPMFWLQGRSDSGTATYTVSAEGVGTAKARVKLTRSAMLIVGPFRAPQFPITLRAQPARITVVAAALKTDGKVGAEQQVAGGSRIQVEITNSNPGVAKLRTSNVVLTGGSSFETTYLEPLTEGETTLAPVQPSGFGAAKEYAAVVAAVAKPGLALSGEIFLGKDLQTGGTLLLGEPAPEGGVEVTLTSSDPSKLRLSLGPNEPGSASIRIPVPAGQFNATYFTQSLCDSGIVTYEATAPGYRSRVARVGLAPSGIIVAYDPYGPPDEAAVLRKSELVENRSFHLSLANPKDRESKLVLWTAYLDAQNGRAADITVQPLRPGVKATVNLTSSNPAVGTVQSPLTIEPGRDHAISTFTAVSKGVTIISIDTPAGFITPKNATEIPVNVND
jgi:hypothetical protein